MHTTVDSDALIIWKIDRLGRNLRDFGEFDVAVDTTSAGPDECAMTIVNALGAVSSPKAFDRLRHRRGT
jgi:hypothetical protein